MTDSNGSNSRFLKSTVHVLLTGFGLALLLLPFFPLSRVLLFTPWLLALTTLVRLYPLIRSHLRIPKRVRSIVPRASTGSTCIASTGLGVAAILAIACFPALGNRYTVDVGVMVGIYSLLALGLNVIVGWAGLLNLGFAAFYAIGAYSYAILNTRFDLPFWPGAVLGVLTAGFAGFLLGLPVLRLRGDYLAIVTLGFGEIVRVVLNNWDSFSNGPNGIMNIDRPVVFSYTVRPPYPFYYLVWITVFIVYFFLNRLYKSHFGRAWIAVRDDELAANAMGIPANRFKLLACIIGGAIAGLAGVLYAAKVSFISPESFTFMESVTILCMVVLGGMGSLRGCIVGAVILVTLPELMRDFSNYRMLLFGAAMVVLMIVRPQGLLPPQRRLEA